MLNNFSSSLAWSWSWSWSCLDEGGVEGALHRLGDFRWWEVREKKRDLSWKRPAAFQSNLQIHWCLMCKNCRTPLATLYYCNKLVIIISFWEAPKWESATLVPSFRSWLLVSDLKTVTSKVPNLHFNPTMSLEPEKNICKMLKMWKTFSVNIK